tara:strand:- start:3385 stop:3603 length:219 start_codon:yes stop_codon:yes gene_type:complete
MKYVIYNMEDVNNINFNEVVESNINTLRISNDGTKTVLKYVGDKPEFLNSYEVYTLTEITQLLTPENGWGTN